MRRATGPRPPVTQEAPCAASAPRGLAAPPGLAPQRLSPPASARRQAPRRARLRDASPAQIRAAFVAVVNLSPREHAAWLRTAQSKSVGTTRPGERETIGRQMGRAVIALSRKEGAQFTSADLALMRKVIGFVRRHRAQRPRGDVTRSRWRYALMNWGHDPVQDE